MNESEQLYIKPDNFIKKIIKKVIPKTLLSKKKEFLDPIIDIFYYRFLKVFYLRIKNPFYKNLPVRHVSAFHSLTKFLTILENRKIDFFLTAGCLLGAVRQESFAGRPTDVDLGIKKEHLPEFLDSFLLLKEKGASLILRFVNENIYLRFHVHLNGVVIDIPVFDLKEENNKKFWIGDFSEKKNYKGIHHIVLPYEELNELDTVNLYGNKFSSPKNPENYLIQKYGLNWKIPEKKQFFWKSPKT